MLMLLCSKLPPYIRTGLSIYLHIMSLLYIDKQQLLPISQCIFVQLMSTPSFFFFMCTFHQRAASSVITKILTVFYHDISLLSIITERCSTFLLGIHKNRLCYLYIDNNPERKSQMVRSYWTIQAKVRVVILTFAAWYGCAAVVLKTHKLWMINSHILPPRFEPMHSRI